MHSLYIWGSTLALGLAAAFSVSAQTLMPGMSGNEVTELQNHLVGAGYLARTVDGDYGSTTREAVALFQKDHGIHVTGMADDSTSERIKEAVGKGYRNGGGIVYAKGNRGSAIAEMQEKLQEAGCLEGTADGVYGTDTYEAVRKYQMDRGIPVSGAIDEMTYSSLMEQEGEADSQRSYGPYVYARGDHGAEIETLQKKLQSMGYLDDIADGIYGENTEEAVRKFQKEHGLSVSGSMDQKTINAVNRKYSSQTGSLSLSVGDSGEKVIRLQNKLLLHGYDPGTVDGIYGAGTEKAVQRLQKEERLAATGVADSNVWERLNSVPRFSGQYKKMLRMTVTAYTPYDGGGSGRTALGNYAGKGHAAVDPDVIPLSSIVYIEGYGYAICDDIGGAVHGMILDVGVDTLQQAYRWGTRKNVKVYLVR